MTRWARRKTVIGGRTAEDDWVVTRDGVALGRVHPAPFILGAPAFVWATWTHPAKNGTADTLDEALQRCRAEIGTKPIPPEIQRKPEGYGLPPKLSS